jgi:hypothetical protein
LGGEEKKNQKKTREGVRRDDKMAQEDGGGAVGGNGKAPRESVGNLELKRPRPSTTYWKDYADWQVRVSFTPQMPSPRRRACPLRTPEPLSFRCVPSGVPSPKNLFSAKMMRRIDTRGKATTLGEREREREREGESEHSQRAANALRYSLLLDTHTHTHTRLIVTKTKKTKTFSQPSPNNLPSRLLRTRNRRTTLPPSSSSSGSAPPQTASC